MTFPQSFKSMVHQANIIPRNSFQTPEEKQACLDRINAQKEAEADKTAEMLKRLQEVSRAQGNVFEELMETQSMRLLDR